MVGRRNKVNVVKRSEYSFKKIIQKKTVFIAVFFYEYIYAIIPTPPPAHKTFRDAGICWPVPVFLQW